MFSKFILALCFLACGMTYGADDNSAKPNDKPKVEAKVPPTKGMVWHTLPHSQVYHVEGDRWYGKTKKGEWLTEADAKAKGYTAAVYVKKEDVAVVPATK